MTRPPRDVLDALVAASPIPGRNPEVNEADVVLAIERGWESLYRVPDRYRDATVDVPELADWAAHLIDAAAQAQVPSIVRGPSLLISGPVGTGKTHAAYAALRHLALSGAYCRWQAVTCADLYGRLRPRHGVDSEAEFSAVTHARVLLLDDLGQAKQSEWTEDVNYRLINHRYERRLPTLFTTNLGPRDLLAALGERVVSRLAEMTTRVVLEGPDRRRPQKGAAA